MPKIFIIHEKTIYIFPFEKETFLSLNRDFFSNRQQFSIFLIEHDQCEKTLKNLMEFLKDFFNISFIEEKGFKIDKWKEVMSNEKDIDSVLSKFTEFAL